MLKKEFNKRRDLRFKKFSRKNYAIFSSLGRAVSIGVLAVSTLTYAKADSISTRPDLPSDSVSISVAADLDEVVVTGSRAPLTQSQAAKIVGVITREDIHRAAVTTLNDVLKLTTGVDVRQRGGYGVQTDISIDGGTFDQITILLNGVNISNPQTGHNATDFPVDISDIERIEVLEGGSSRLFGSSAFSGAINIVTRKAAENQVQATLRGGSYGTVGGSGRVGLTNRQQTVFGSLSGGYDRSDGYSRSSDGRLNSGFEKIHFYYEGGWDVPHLYLYWQAGTAIQHYGANTFYSPKFDNQYEGTEHDIVSLKATVKDLPAGIEIEPLIYYNRFLDHYQLIKGMTGAAAGENYHDLDVYGAAANAFVPWVAGKTSVGFDLRKENILSTAYGRPLPEADQKPISGTDRAYDHKAFRTNTSIFLEHNFIYKGFTLSAGVLANRNSALDNDFHFYPGIDLGFRPDNRWKVFASWNKAMRMPTFTDLYADNAVQVGDVNLHPEHNSSFNVGARFRNNGIETVVKAFYSHGTDMIDWAYESAEAIRYHALNIGELNNAGVSVDASVDFCQLIGGDTFVTNARVGYAYINQSHSTTQPIYRSLYALEYLRHKVTLGVDHRIVDKLSASWAMRWQQRMNGFHPYTKIDCKLTWNDRLFDLYLQADNITNHPYYDIGGVLQPGLWVMAGATLHLNL